MVQTLKNSGPRGSVEKSCVFCNLSDKRDEVVLVSDYFVVKNDSFPIVTGHLLIIPKRHIESPIDLSNSEWEDMRFVIEEACLISKSKDNEITGFNIGINIGRDAGQTVDHMHVHIIPRRSNDIPDSKCGVRMINPRKADYTNEL
jgi:diadenosine tetraphosphate (Ap4A) HIT family hydrolase